MRLVEVTIVLFALFSCKYPVFASKKGNVKDTIVLLSKDTSLVTGLTFVPVLLNISGDKKLLVDTSKRILLLLNGPKIISAPDGAYEVYITNTLAGITELSATQKNFASLLDLYSFTAPGTKQQIEIDISAQVKFLYQKNQTSSPLYLVFRFAPVQNADGTFSSKAGSISFTGLSIVQVK